MENNDLRKEKIAARGAMDVWAHRLKSRMISLAIALTPAWQEAESVLLYLPFRREVDIEELISLGWYQKKNIYVPRCIPATLALEIIKLEDMNQLQAGHYGLREPNNESIVSDPQVLDLIIIPGSVYDKQGGRLGYGAGYYDRFLLQCRDNAVRMAPCFDIQIVDEVKRGSHDQLMDVLVTEKQIFDIERV